MTARHCSPVFSFAAFVTWLLAVPMDGPLLSANGLPALSFYFLLPHVLGLFLLGYRCSKTQLERLLPYGAVLTVLLTSLLPFFGTALPWIGIPLGFSGALVAVAACARLRQSATPVCHAAIGLVGANLVLFALLAQPQNSPWFFTLLSLPLLSLLLKPKARSAQALQRGKSALGELWLILPFILLFHLVGGLMYSFMYPAYLDQAMAPGLELFFYIGTVSASAKLVKSNRELSLMGGILLAMLAFILLQTRQPLAVNWAMFSMQAGQGIIDLFLIVYLLSFNEPIRAFGFGLATLCLGVSGGQLLGASLQQYAGSIALTGLICLNLAALSLYYYRWRIQQWFAEQSPSQPVAQPEPVQITLPDSIRLQLSDREFLVLQHSLNGMTYRDIASQLEISESSVKTYMKRVYDKLGMRSRKDLASLVNSRG